MNDYELANKRFVVGGIIAAILVIALALAFAVVPAGHRGVVTRFGAVNRTMAEGLQMKWPFIESVRRMDCRVKKLQTEANAASRDMQDVLMIIAVNYRVNAEQVASLYGTVGMQYEDTLIGPAIQESVKAASAGYSAEELITRRVDVSRSMEQRLSQKLAKYGVIIDSLNVVNLQFSKEFMAAIEAKQAAEQMSEKAKRDLDRIRTEAEQKIVQAKAEAESLRIQRQDITPDLLRLREIEAMARAIEKWDGKLPSVTGGAVPFVDVRK